MEEIVELGKEINGLINDADSVDPGNYYLLSLIEKLNRRMDYIQSYLIKRDGWV